MKCINHNAIGRSGLLKIEFHLYVHYALYLIGQKNWPKMSQRTAILYV